MNFLKTNWLGILVIVLFIWLMFKPSGCGPTPSWMKRSNDTVRVETTTKYVPQPPVYIPTYIPRVTTTTYPVYIPQDRQPSGDITELTEQYNNLLKDFLAVKTYKDSIILRDTAGTRVGVVNLNDKVTENSIVERSPDYQLTFPHTTTTITLREPPKNQLYIGGGITGNVDKPVNGATIGLSFIIKFFT